MRKKVNKYGNRTYTVQELQELLPKLEGDRTTAQALGKKMGMRIYIIDLLRGLLGFTATTPAKIPQEKIDKLIKHRTCQCAHIAERFGPTNNPEHHRKIG